MPGSRNETKLMEAELTRSVIGSFYEVHRELGFGYREHIYSLALAQELLAKGHRVDREVRIMVYYKGKPLAWQMIDMLIDGKLIVESKATERLHPSGTLQLFSYLCGTTVEVGLLLHYGREAKFYRVICENRFKKHGTSSGLA